MSCEIHGAKVREGYCNLTAGARYCGGIESFQLFICGQRRRQDRLRNELLTEAIRESDHTNTCREQHSIETGRQDGDFFRVGQLTCHAFCVEKVRFA